MTNRFIGFALGAAMLAAPFAWAGDDNSHPIPQAAQGADVIFLGEQHDNPAHHRLQAAWVAELAPKAIVFEMLTSEQASRITTDNRRNAETLEAALDWEASGWPDFDMYFPIFEAAPDAAVFGAAVPREQLRDMMQKELKDVAEALNLGSFQLDSPLSEDEQTKREALQRAAHCDALPEDMFPFMVNVQRIRDAALAHAAHKAITAMGGPVVVITGNGHSREDWGAPFLLRQTSPDLAVFSLGQGEAGQMPDGGFGTVIDGPAVDRGDPCDAFN